MKTCSVEKKALRIETRDEVIQQGNGSIARAAEPLYRRTSTSAGWLKQAAGVASVEPRCKVANGGWRGQWASMVSMRNQGKKKSTDGRAVASCARNFVHAWQLEMGPG